jgi:replicative DNA helicase
MPLKNPKITPQDLEAEVSVLGAIMLDKDAIVKVIDIIQPEDFYKQANREIYEVLTELFGKSQPIDILTVTSRLKEKGVMETVGGSSYLSDIISEVPSSAHIEKYATIVKEKRVRRDLIRASGEIHENVFKEDDFEGLLDSVEKRIFSISQLSHQQKFVHIKDYISAANERMDHIHRGDGELRGVPTGFKSIDNILSGLQKSDLILLGARPSVGKTTLALDIARLAAHSGKAVGIFSIEMSHEQIMDRLIAAEAQVPLWRLRTGKLQDNDFSIVQHAFNELSKLPIYVDDTPAPNILQIRGMARRLQLEHRLDLVVIDYLQLIRPRTESHSMVQQVTEISRGLKSIARELSIPVLALSQLSRAVAQRGDKPRLSDLRESGSLEQDSDVVMFLHRENKDKLDTPTEEQNMIEILIAKHRNGPLGTITLKFDHERVSFREIDTRHTEQ